jgi:D-lactate dehydrogenase (cytochrome)
VHQHRIRARRAQSAAAPRVDDDPAVVSAFLSDAAHVPGGHAAGVTFPRNEGEVAAAVSRAARVLPVGAQSSLTGGATPRGDLVISTRALVGIGVPSGGCIDVGAGVPLAVLQRRLADVGLYYPPVPTFDGAFLGGTIATNAAGAATFKYGSTRAWVEALTVVLANGNVLDVSRGEACADDDGRLAIALADGTPIEIQVPRYVMPGVPKLSAGYYARPGMDLVDLFIGSEGTLGTIIAARVRVIPRPRRCLALVRCRDDAQAIALTGALRMEARDAWKGHGPLDVAAIEYMDARALGAVPDEAFARAAVDRPPRGSVLLLVQIETGAAEDAALDRLGVVLAAHGVSDDPRVTNPEDERAAARLFELREAVPAGVNAIVAAAKARVHDGIQKTAGDMVVPFERLADSVQLYRQLFEDRALDYAIWGHVSDGNLHPNVIPRSLEDVERGHAAILDMARAVIAMGGAPLAEHGVGRSALKQHLLRELYGEEGIEQMRAVKRALDPTWKLAPGVLFPESPSQ